MLFLRARFAPPQALYRQPQAAHPCSRKSNRRGTHAAQWRARRSRALHRKHRTTRRMQRRLRLLQQPMPPLDKGRMKTAPTVPPSRKALIALSKSNSVLLGTLNCRTLMHRCLQGELVLDCIRKGISVLAIQEHRIVFPSRGKGDRNHLESFPAGIGWKLILQSATRQTNNAAYGGVGFLVAPGI